MRNEVSHRVKETGISYVQQKEGRLFGLVTSCVGTAFCNTLLKEEVTGRRGRRCKQLLYAFKEMGEYWKLTEEASERGRRLWTCRKRNYMVMTMMMMTTTTMMIMMTMITTTMMMMMMMIELLRAACCTSVGVLSFYLPKESR
jgi:hypothetical protein